MLMSCCQHFGRKMFSYLVITCYSLLVYCSSFIFCEMATLFQGDQSKVVSECANYFTVAQCTGLRSAGHFVTLWQLLGILSLLTVFAWWYAGCEISLKVLGM